MVRGRMSPVPTAKAAATNASDLNPRRDPPLDFPDKDFGELTAADYDALGFMCGLEVHQQLDTARKLFCRCPAGIRTTRVDAEVLRHMRPTLSELGEYDGTALMEFKTKKDIVYQLERGSVCTYEMDDTPPFPIDPEAVKISLAVCKLFGLDLVSELHVMRKQYLDGSIPTGFQRTAMVGLGGEIPFRDSELGSGRALRIRQLSLEEDSCREVSDIGHRIVFRTDRLGMPLIETVTEPELLTPLDAQRGGKLLADVARVSGRVRRGPGAARQDVNVSIAGGRRVEIKGVSNHRILPVLVHNEAFRQLALLRVKAELERRGVTRDLMDLPAAGMPWEVSPLVVDARSAIKRTDYAPIHDALERGDMVAAVRLRGFRGLLATRTQPGITFARELSHRVRVIACLESRPFMIHSDVKDYGLRGSQWAHLRAVTKADDEDALVVVWGPAADVATAAREVLARAAEGLDGVPSETRQSFADGTTGFERILPGPDRMYPDTDTPPLPIPDAWVEEVDAARPELPWQRRDRYVSVGLTDAAAARLCRAPWADLFDELAPAEGDVARRVAAAFEKRLPGILRAGDALPDVGTLRPVVEALAAGDVIADAFEDLMMCAVREPGADVLAGLGGGDPAGDLDSRIAELRARTGELRTGDPDARVRWGMGLAMIGLRGRVEPAAVRARVAEVVANV